jgi:hypothetical protein
MRWANSRQPLYLHSRSLRLCFDIGAEVFDLVVIATGRAGPVPQLLSQAYQDRGIMCMDLLEELEAPRLVVPRPLDARARFCDWDRTPRVLLLRSSIDFVADHEEEASGREEKYTGGG